jgi:hypothetical protein
LVSLIHLLLHGVVLGHCVWVGSDTDSEEVELGTLVGGEDADIAILTPVGTPGVFYEPPLLTISLALPANNLDNLLTIELERVISAVVYAILVGKDVSEYNHLSDDGAILQNLFFDTKIILS